MRYREVLEAFPVTDEFRQDYVDALTDYHGEHNEYLDGIYEDWYKELSELHENGGEVFRVVFVNDIKEVRQKGFGQHWSTRRLTLDVIDKLWDNASENHATEHKLTDRFHFDKCILITARIPANNITLDGVNSLSYWYEFEVRLIDPSKVTVLNIEEIYSHAIS